MKEQYTSLSIEITEIAGDDVITTSGEGFWGDGLGDGDTLEGLLLE